MSLEAGENYQTLNRDENQYNKDRTPGVRSALSPISMEPQVKISIESESGDCDDASTLFSKKSESFEKYQEDSEDSFSQAEKTRKRIEIVAPGSYVLSVTENGESSVLFNPYFYEEKEATKLFENIYYSTKWHEKNIIINGAKYLQPRLVAWYGPFAYSYSQITMVSKKMPRYILKIKDKVERYLRAHGIDVELNSVLLNLYRDHKDSVAWHSDDELTLGVCPTIASVSLGETRKFEMRRKQKHSTDERSRSKEYEYFVHLTNGSLITMNGCMQKDWQHRVPKEYYRRYERINLTFRTVYELNNVRNLNSPEELLNRENLFPERVKLEGMTTY